MFDHGHWVVYRRFQGDVLAFGWRWVGGWGLRVRIFSWRILSWGKRISMKGVQDFLELFKKEHNEKRNKKKVCSTGSNEQH